MITNHFQEGYYKGTSHSMYAPKNIQFNNRSSESTEESKRSSSTFDSSFKKNDFVKENNQDSFISYENDPFNNQQLHVEHSSVPKNQNVVLEPINSFEELKLPPSLLNNLYLLGFNKPSKIQKTALPLLLHNPPINLVCQAQSGTGKTAAFLINIISRINMNLNLPQAIVLAPTRELSIQIYDIIIKMGLNTSLQVQPLIKEILSNENINTIDTHIIVGTPGTILSNIRKNKVNTSNINCFVIDEADAMLDAQGLRDQTIRIKKLIKNKFQTILFSATFPQSLKDFAKRFAPNANQITLEEKMLKVDAIKQFIIDCTNNFCNKFDVLCDLYALMTVGQSIIFVKTKIDADKISQKMIEHGHHVATLHGNLQVVERDKIMHEFRTGFFKVLVATNVISRGIDIPTVNMVINYDLPTLPDNTPDYETYIHRIGRTGRFGKSGASINFIHTKNEFCIIQQIIEKYNLDITTLNLDNWEHMEKVLKNANR